MMQTNPRAKFFLIFISLFIVTYIEAEKTSNLPFKKVIIWGHKLHTHTHSYIHYAFYKAFKYLGYETFWFDNNDNIRNFDFSNCLFISEGQVDQKMPVREDCRYILHYARDEKKYKKLLEMGNYISLYTYLNTTEELGRRPSQNDINQETIKIDNYTMYSVAKRYILIPWATDLLPYEIEENKKKVSLNKEQVVYWVGTFVEDLNPFIQACRENNVQFKHIDPWTHPVSPEENVTLIQKSFIAPAIQRKWQIDNCYIPCRIFKNISYGQMGITNSKTVYELFDRKIIYNNNCHQLFYDVIERVKTLKVEDIYELMDFVKEKHTYINRINTLLDFLHLIKPLENYKD